MNQFIPYGRQDVTQEDIDSILKILKSDFLTQGPAVEIFEQKISKKLNAKHAISVNSATSALHLACIALELSANDFLWTSPISFVASANCARYCSAKVDFMDIDPSTGLISIPKLIHKLERAEKKGNLPKIVVPVHLAGTSCDMKSIYSLSNKYGFKVIEDASHALGGKYHGKPVGNCRYSDITIFSFHPVKIITTGEGGAALTNNDDLALNMKMNRSHGITKNIDKFVLKDYGPWSYEQQSLGFNYRLNDIQAALGSSQLDRLELIVDERNHKLSKYSNAFKDSAISLLEIPKNVITSGHLAIIKFNKFDKDLHKSIFLKLRAKNIGVQLHYSPIHLQPYYRAMGFRKGDFPEAEFYSQNSFSIPLYPSLKIEEQEYVIQTIKNMVDQS